MSIFEKMITKNTDPTLDIVIFVEFAIIKIKMFRLIHSSIFSFRQLSVNPLQKREDPLCSIKHYQVTEN